MENIILQKIKDGDNGQQAANKIWANDEKLRNAINALKDYLDSYGALVTIQVSGGTIGLATSPGTGEGSESSVMTQKAVTEFVYSEDENDCIVGETIGVPVEMPTNSEIVPGLWATRASSNAEGNSLTTLYNDVQDLKNIINVVNELQEQIQSLTARVANLEAIVLTD